MLVNQIVLHRINPFFCSFPFNSLEVCYSRVLLYPCCYASQTLRFFCFCEPVWPSSWTATTSTSPTSPSATAEATLSQNRFRSASTLWSSRTTSTQFHLFTTFSNIHVSSLSNCEMRIIFNWMVNSCLCRLTFFFFFMDLPLREGTEAACVYFKVEVHRQPLSLITRTQFQFINGILACTLYYFLIPVSMKESFGFHFGELLLGWHEGQTNSTMIGNRSRHPGLLMLHKKQPNLYDSAW